MLKAALAGAFALAAVGIGPVCADTYGRDSGGDPKHIPDLTWDALKEFHRKYYHPSNARIFFYGDDDPDEQLANVDAPTGDTAPVGSYPDGVSVYGVLDMTGNVEEWVADWYGKDYYADSPALNPVGPAPSTPPLKVLRGGSYQQGRYDSRTSVRGRANPETKYGNVGFRIVVTDPPTAENP